MIGLTSSMIRDAERRAAWKRIEDRAWLYLFGFITGATLILIFTV
jgi:hypothetical protein